MSIDSVYHILVQDFIGRDIYVPWRTVPHARHVEEHHYPSAKKADNLVPTKTPIRNDCKFMFESVSVFCICV